MHEADCKSLCVKDFGPELIVSVYCLTAKTKNDTCVCRIKCLKKKKCNVKVYWPKTEIVTP